jgi:DNA-binding transcriptional MerR regulator
VNGVGGHPHGTGSKTASTVEADMGAKKGIKIGELIKRTGVTRATVHHYVREGLLPEPEKTSRNMALYDPSCVDRVQLIKGLQAQTRRSLSEVKTLLEDAADHEGIRHLANMLELEALRTQASPLTGDTRRVDLSVKKLSERTGFSMAEIQEFDNLGLITIHEQGRRRLVRPADVAVADALAALAQAGFDDEAGFEPKHAVIYLEALKALLHQEVALFFEKTDPMADPEALLKKAEMAIERVSPLMLAIRRKLIGDLIEAAPIAGVK